MTAELARSRPEYRAELVVARNLRIGPSTPAGRAYLDAAAGQARAVLGDGGPADHPHLAEWRRIYSSFGAKPSRYPCSAAALARRAQRGDLPAVNDVVDLYNAVSVRHLVPVGGENIDAVRGALTLRLAVGTEPSDIVERPDTAPEPPAPGEPVWADDIGVTCRRWNWRQGRRTALVEGAVVDAVFVLDAAGPMAYDAVALATAELSGLLAEWKGATVSTGRLEVR